LNDFVHSSEIFFSIIFLATREVVAPPANNPIMLQDQYSCLDTLNIKIRLLLQILEAVLELGNNLGGVKGGVRSEKFS